MDKEDQIEFVEELCDHVKNKILRYIDANKIPESWDGIELRRLIAEQYQNIVYDHYSNKSKRIKDYKNYVLINNL